MCKISRILFPLLYSYCYVNPELCAQLNYCVMHSFSFTCYRSFYLF